MPVMATSTLTLTTLESKVMETTTMDAAGTTRIETIDTEATMEMEVIKTLEMTTAILTTIDYDIPSKRCLYDSPHFLSILI